MYSYLFCDLQSHIFILNYLYKIIIMSKEYNVNSIELNEKDDCKTCTRGLNVGQKFVVLFSFYMLATSIYGTVKLIQLLINSF